jgi:hypothetical protein
MPLPQRDISNPGFGAIALGIAGIALASDLILQRPLSRSNALPGRRLVPAVLRDKPTSGRTTVTAARRLNRAAGTLAVSVLVDSAIEHYRGSMRSYQQVRRFLTAVSSPAQAWLWSNSSDATNERCRRIGLPAS